MKKYEIERRVEYYEADTTQKLSLPMILNLAVLASKNQSDELGVGQDYHLAMGLGWVILQYEVKIKRRPKVGELMRIQTYAAEYNPFLYDDLLYFLMNQVMKLLRCHQFGRCLILKIVVWHVCHKKLLINTTHNALNKSLVFPIQSK